MRGMDSNLVDSFDYDLAVGHVRTDVLTDFIIAPQYSAVFTFVADELIDTVKRMLRNAEYSSGILLRIDIPKATGLSRPGAILTPIDRVVYQLLADAIGPLIESQLDRTRVFSYVFLEEDSEFHMFKSHDECWRDMQDALQAKCQDTDFPIVLKTDIAAYFERIYQHNLINLLRSSGCDSRIANFLEDELLEFTNRNSHGILQGMFPSDLLGNFYLASLDSYLRIREIPSIRFVDDLYLFFPNKLNAQKGLIELCRILRSEGLNLNESKTRIDNAENLIEEETEIDRLFMLAKQEICDTDLPILIESQYGFQTAWVPGDVVLEPVQIELQAVEDLYTEGIADERKSEKVERFCLPYLAQVQNTVAIEMSLDNITARPHLSKVYCNYLMNLIKDNTEISAGLESIISGQDIPYDWSLIWPIVVLTEADTVSNIIVDKAIQIVQDTNRIESLRSTAVFLAAKHGTAAQRRILKNRYESEPSSFVREAILFASKYFPTDERNSCIRAWGSHSVTNLLIAQAVRVSSSTQ